VHKISHRFAVRNDNRSQNNRKNLEVIMRRLGFAFTLFCLLLAACAAPPADIPAASPGPATRTATPSATLTPGTPTPDATNTPTRTPLPTIPTFTPTFDARTIVTATSAPRAECPQENPAQKSDFILEDTNMRPEQQMLKFLNENGSFLTISKNLKEKQAILLQEDLTRDGIAEIVFSIQLDYPQKLYIFTCNNEKYALYESNGSYVLGVFDMNLNGIPEIVVVSRVGSGGGSYRYFILEWNGNTYINLASDEWIDNVIREKIIDTNKDGTLELLVYSMPTWAFPPREQVHVFMWNGSFFVAQPEIFNPPVYRFQAIQDGDINVLSGKYNAALLLYSQAIYDEMLKSWSPQDQIFMQEKFQAQQYGYPTPTPIPSTEPLDPTEYPRLAAYAYYRMLILHTFLGEMDSAQVKYATLQEKFPSDSPGHPYVEMATDFWNAYQSSGRMYDACAAAIAYADAHPEILVPLGSNYHGAQSHQYQPADVCPFR
jgi:hypothetical protein